MSASDELSRGDVSCDVLVVGSGGAALTAAVTARKSGLDVIVAEKQEVFGGTTATSGGMLWIPGNHHAPALRASLSETDSTACARDYILQQAGNYADPDRIDSFLKHGPEMVDFLEKETYVRFEAAEHPDYYMDNPNARKSRSLASVEYDAGRLGHHARELKGELPQMLFFGFAIGSAVEMKQFFQAGHSPKAFVAVAGKMTRHLFNSAVHGGPRRLVRGRALIARLAHSLFELDVPILLSSPARELIVENGAVRGAIVEGPGGRRRILVSRGVILGSGGFPYDIARRKEAYPAHADDGVVRSAANPGNTGDGARMAEQVGGVFGNELSNAAAWMPTSVRPDVPGPPGVWPHLVDRLKPGFIAVSRHGTRFGNESSAYSSFVPQMLEATRGDPQAFAWVIGDRAAVDKWGIGRVRPKPLPRRGFIRSGYLVEAGSVAELAGKIGIDPAALEATVKRFNAHAAQGADPDFGRGGNEYDAYQGDPDHRPNPCLGPLEKAPFYAVKIFPGEIGTFAGIRTDRFARAIDGDGQPIAGLYAVGNDQMSVFGGAYPGAGSTLGPGLTFGYVAGKHVAGLLGDDVSERRAA